MFDQILILFAVSVVLVTLLRKFHLPPLLGYVATGILIGPYGFDVLPDHKELAFVAEFGVVFLLFTIGLELSLPKILSMRRSLLRLGGLQVLFSALLTGTVATWFGLSFPAAFTIAGAIALSSTAIASKLLIEQDELNLRHGKMALSILLFQDLAAIPFLVLVPELASDGQTALSVVLTVAALKGLLIITAILFLGRRLLRPIYHLVAKARSTELFMLTTLLVVMVSAWATESFGLSLALGGFLAGAVLAETEFVHQIEHDIEPFRDIFLGLFFVTIGMLLNPMLVLHEWLTLLWIVTALILVKTAIITLLGVWAGESKKASMRTGLVLAQGGEFGFALLTLAHEQNVLTEQTNQIIIASIILSMLIAPFLIRYNRVIARALFPNIPSDQTLQEKETLVDQADELQGHVILCGYGRVGQTLGWFLESEGIPFIGLDLDSKRLLESTAAKEPVFYGDASDLAILERAGIARANLLIVCFDEQVRALKLIRAVREASHKLPLLVRTRDDRQLEELLAAGATEVVPELLEASLMLASHMLMLLGKKPVWVQQHILEIQKNRYHMLRGYYAGELVANLEEEAVSADTLHAVELEESAWAVGKTIPEIQASGLILDLASFRRGGFKSPAPCPETALKAGDVLVLRGKAAYLNACEDKLLRG